MSSPTGNSRKPGSNRFPLTKPHQASVHRIRPDDGYNGYDTQIVKVCEKPKLHAYYLLYQLVKEEKLIAPARGGGRSKQRKYQNVKNDVSLDHPACFQSFLIC